MFVCSAQNKANLILSTFALFEQKDLIYYNFAVLVGLDGNFRANKSFFNTSLQEISNMY